MKLSTHDPFVPPERQHYKKKYIVRRLEEKEAEDEIRAAKSSSKLPENLPAPPSMDEEGRL